MDRSSLIVNVADVAELADAQGAWGQAYKPLTPGMEARGGRLGMNQTRLTKGQVACPHHHHLRDDEMFFVLSGRGLLRYGDELFDLAPGDTVSCPAGTGIAHQIANPFDDDLVYLAIGPNDPHEVCVYPDSGKVYVRGIKRIGFLEKADYMAGESDSPRILEMFRARAPSPASTPRDGGR